MLHGGITAFLAETLASLGGQIASQWARVAGIDLTVSHLQSAPVGSEVIAKAVPLRVGKRVQVSIFACSLLVLDLADYMLCVEAYTLDHVVHCESVIMLEY